MKDKWCNAGEMINYPRQSLFAVHAEHTRLSVPGRSKDTPVSTSPPNIEDLEYRYVHLCPVYVGPRVLNLGSCALFYCCKNMTMTTYERVYAVEGSGFQRVRVSMTIIAGNMAEGRQTWYWNSS